MILRTRSGSPPPTGLRSSKRKSRRRSFRGVRVPATRAISMTTRRRRCGSPAPRSVPRSLLNSRGALRQSAQSPRSAGACNCNCIRYCDCICNCSCCCHRRGIADHVLIVVVVVLSICLLLTTTTTVTAPPTTQKLQPHLRLPIYPYLLHIHTIANIGFLTTHNNLHQRKYIIIEFEKYIVI